MHFCYITNIGPQHIVFKQQLIKKVSTALLRCNLANEREYIYLCAHITSCHINKMQKFECSNVSHIKRILKQRFIRLHSITYILYVVCVSADYFINKFQLYLLPKCFLNWCNLNEQHSFDSIILYSSHKEVLF